MGKTTEKPVEYRVFAGLCPNCEVYLEVDYEVTRSSYFTCPNCNKQIRIKSPTIQEDADGTV